MFIERRIFKKCKNNLIFQRRENQKDIATITKLDYALQMEYTGFEPVASTMRMLRAPNCANTPRLNYYITENIKMEEFFDLYLQDFSGYNLIQPAVQLLNSRTMIMR